MLGKFRKWSIVEMNAVRARFNTMICALGLLALAGCVSSQPADFLAPVDLPESDPNVVQSGNYPSISEVPKGQTTQITRSERDAETAELKAAAERGKAQRDNNAEARYRKEISDLKREAEEAKNKRLQQIKSKDTSS